MIEPIMYFGIGFLVALLATLFVIPRIHRRAVRLTMQRLEASLPLSMAELQADKDQLRAEFAMLMRRFEINVEQLKNRVANQFAELGKKGDAINRLKIEVSEKTASIFALEARNEALRHQLRSTEDEITAKTGALHDAALSDKQAEVETVRELYEQSRFAASPLSPQNDYHFQKSAAAEELQLPGPLPESVAKRSPADRNIGIAGERSHFSTGLRAVEPPIRVLPKDQFAGNKPSNERRTFPILARLFIAVLIGTGALYGWHYRGSEAKNVVRTWILSLGGLSSVSTTKSPVDADVIGQTSASSASRVSAHDVAPQLGPVAQTTPVPAASSAEQQSARIITTLPAPEQHIGHTMSAPPGMKPTPAPETRPTTIEGWTLLEVADDAVVLEGPHGVWRATRGDTVPGVGRVMSVVLWGNRWIVSTTKGLISTP
jgi:hypothetical protein